jgi:hypothetical protein
MQVEIVLVLPSLELVLATCLSQALVEQYREVDLVETQSRVVQLVETEIIKKVFHKISRVDELS